MAETTVTVKPSGGDYSTLAAAENNEETNLVTATKRLHIVCSAMTENAATRVQFGSGWGMDATYYVSVEPEAGAEAGMPWRSSGAYTAPGLDLLTPYVAVRNIQVRTTSASWPALWFRTGAAAGASASYGVHAVATANNCLISNGAVKIYNSIFRGAASKYGFRATSGASGFVENCTSIALTSGSGTGIQQDVDGAVIVRNNVSYDWNAAFDDQGGSWNADSDYNASDDVTAPGANSLHSISDPFEDFSGGDFHLASGSALAAAGTPLTGTYTDDFDGETRWEWSIGADELPAPIGASLGVSGVWKDVTAAWVGQSGSWVAVTSAWVGDSSTWKEFI